MSGSFELVEHIVQFPLGPGGDPADRACCYTGWCECYRYYNEEGSFPAMLYRNNDNKISFSSLGETTDWHGEWRLHADKRAVLKFHHRGNLKKLRTAMLFRSAPGLYTGFDYLGRAVRLELCHVYRFCETHGEWHLFF